MDFQLSEKATAEIDAKLPDLKKVSGCLLFDAALIARQTGPKSSLDIAATCFRDAYIVVADAHYALDRAYQCLIWFREEAPNAPDEYSGVYRAKFYADDVALRLYSSAEHLAAFIVNYFAIPKADLTALREHLNKKSKITVSSHQAIVGQYMIKNYPDHKITAAIKDLLKETNWKRTRDYRDDWVHNQAPLLEGMGVRYERKSRWVEGQDFDGQDWGLDDKPSLTIEALLEMITTAFNAYARCLSELFDVLLTDIENLGIKINFEKYQISYPADRYR